MAKTIRFREAYAQYESIVKAIRAREFAPIYLLMGEEGYFIDSLTDISKSSAWYSHPLLLLMASAAR